MTKNVVMITDADKGKVIPVEEIKASCSWRVVAPQCCGCAYVARASRILKFGRRLIKMEVIRDAYDRKWGLDNNGGIQSKPECRIEPKTGNKYEIKLEKPVEEGPLAEYYDELFEASGKAYDEYIKANPHGENGVDSSLFS